MATTIHRIRGANRARRGELELLLSLQGASLRNRREILRDGLPTPTSGVLDFEEVPFAALCRACQDRRDVATGWGGRVASGRTGSLGQ